MKNNGTSKKTADDVIKELIDIIGNEATSKLCANFGGRKIDIPKLEDVLKGDEKEGIVLELKKDAHS